MLDIRWIFVFLSFTMHSLAQMPSKSCGPPQIFYKNTKIISPGSIRNKYAPAEKVFYECKEGFTSTGGHFVSACTKAGKWTPASLTCEKVGAVKLCSEPVVSNGVPSRAGSSGSSGYREGDSVTFTCSPGFIQTVAHSATCGADGTWTPPLPQCLPVPPSGDEAKVPVEDVTCKGPNQFTKITKIHGSDVIYRPGDSLSFSGCTDGRTLNGSNTVTCGPDGKWSPSLPKCIWLKCPELNVPNGKLSNGYKRVNSEVTVTCHAGHHLQGAGTVTCLESLKWSNIPQCQPDAKPVEKTCASPAVDNSVSTGRAEASYRVGETLTFICKQGFQLDGPPQVTCGTAGQWQPRLPKCLLSVKPTVQPTTSVKPAVQPTTSVKPAVQPTTSVKPTVKPTPSVTPKPPAIGECDAPRLDNQPNILLHDYYITQKSTAFPAGSRVRYVCELGYVPSGGSSYRHCVQGKWTRMTLTCERKSCGSAGEISNGQFMYTGSEFGDSATGVCDEGYDMVGQKTRRCMSSGLWDGRVPVCEVVHCPDPPAVMDAVMSGAFEPHTYRSVVSYRCRKGTLSGNKQLWCTKDGTWSDPPPTCKDISCPVLSNVPNSSRTGALRAPYKHRDAVSFRCDRGYVLVGSVTVSCGIDGQWSPKLPTCTGRWGRNRY